MEEHQRKLDLSSFAFLFLGIGLGVMICMAVVMYGGGFEAWEECRSNTDILIDYAADENVGYNIINWSDGKNLSTSELLNQ